jgi:asparagine synthetase B (glutamine-hydrolysing)
MCGILAILSLGVELAALRALVKRDFNQEAYTFSNDQFKEIECNIMPALIRRGPDLQKWSTADIGNGGGMLSIFSTVLHLRGETRCDQPVVDKDGNILAWNGEVFGGQVKVVQGCSDTAAISSRLSEVLPAD